jgi:large subunit ribosomal protein L17
MNHGNKVNHLGRTASHRKAMLSNMAASLILHKKITTTVSKAKELRKFVEPLITKAKDNTTHSRRVVFSALKYKEPVKELFGEVAAKVADRPGGYTRILKTGNRLGDNAEMCIMELVDYNETYTTGKKAPVKTRRKRAAGKKTAAETAAETAAPEKKAKAPKKSAPKSDESVMGTLLSEEEPVLEPGITEIPGISQPEEGNPGSENDAQEDSSSDTENKVTE